MKKRLFFGFEVMSPWPEQFPAGKVIKEESRHLTLLFLGDVDYPSVSNALNRFPKPFFKVGVCGVFDQCLFLPPQRPKVVAWHAQLFTDAQLMESYFKRVINWAENEKIPFKSHPSFLPHVTMARSPFEKKAWEQDFVKIPFITSNLHLYESFKNSIYEPIETWEIKAPIEEVMHTADVAFIIRGTTFQQLAIHAQIALCFLHPPLLSFAKWKDLNNLNELIYSLNQLISIADAAQGVPLKAVSYHGQIENKEPLLEWEMIIDV